MLDLELHKALKEDPEHYRTLARRMGWCVEDAVSPPPKKVVASPFRRHFHPAPSGIGELSDLFETLTVDLPPPQYRIHDEVMTMHRSAHLAWIRIDDTPVGLLVDTGGHAEGCSWWILAAFTKDCGVFMDRHHGPSALPLIHRWLKETWEVVKTKLAVAPLFGPEGNDDPIE